jgi:group I intron endonuclease
MAGGIYHILNTVNGKRYIGSARNIDTRWKQHRRELRENRHHSITLQRAWNKYGEQAFVFEILDEIDYSSILLVAEQCYLSMNFGENGEKLGYNIYPTAGGSKGAKHRPEVIARRIGRKCTEESRRKMSESHIGKLLPEEQKRKIGEAHKKWHTDPENKKKHHETHMGRFCSEETRHKISERQKGKVIPIDQRIRISNTLMGKVQSEETKEKRRQSLLKTYADPAVRANLKASRRIMVDKPEYREKMRAITTARYKDPEWHKKTSVTSKLAWDIKKKNMGVTH